MARFRIFNVRVGGGRKASIGFHGGPVGVTFGGRRKKKFQYTKLTSEANDSAGDWTVGIPERDLIMAGLRNPNTDEWIFHAFVAFMVTLFVLIMLMGVISIITPLLYGILAISSIWCSVYFFVSWNRLRKFRNEEKSKLTKSELKSLEFARNGVVLTDIPVLGFTFKKRARMIEAMQRKYEEHEIPESHRQKYYQPSNLPFFMVPVLNLIFNFALTFPAAATYSIVQTEVDSDCFNRTATYKTSVGVRGPCEELIGHFSNLKVALGLVYLSIGLAFLVSIRTGAYVKLFKSIKAFSKNFLEPRLNSLSEENRARIKTFLEDRNLTRRK